MNLRALRYFVRIAEYGSISHAALHLHVAQPALSRQIRKLEEDLGVRLMTRTAQGVTLTGPGETLLHHGKRILREVEETRLAVLNEEQDVVGPVTVAAEPTLGAMLMPLLLKRVRATYPKVTLSLFEGLTTRIQEGLIDGSFDIGVMQTPRQEEGAHLSITPLLVEPLVFVGPGVGQPRQRKKNPPITLHELVHAGLILPSRPNALRVLVEEIAAKHGIMLNMLEEVDGMMIIKALVERGLGHTLHSYSYVNEEVRKGFLDVRMIDPPIFQRELSMARLRGRKVSIAVTHVMEEIKASVAHLISSGDLLEFSEAKN